MVFFQNDYSYEACKTQTPYPFCHTIKSNMSDAKSKFLQLRFLKNQRVFKIAFSSYKAF